MIRQSDEMSQQWQCPLLDQCELISENLDKMPELILRTKDRFCSNPELECARRRIKQTLGDKMVPPLMLPEQMDWAEQIIDENNSGARKDSKAVPA